MLGLGFVAAYSSDHEPQLLGLGMAMFSVTIIGVRSACRIESSTGWIVGAGAALSMLALLASLIGLVQWSAVVLLFAATTIAYLCETGLLIWRRPA